MATNAAPKPEAIARPMPVSENPSWSRSSANRTMMEARPAEHPKRIRKYGSRFGPRCGPDPALPPAGGLGPGLDTWQDAEHLVDQVGADQACHPAGVVDGSHLDEVTAHEVEAAAAPNHLEGLRHS